MREVERGREVEMMMMKRAVKDMEMRRGRDGDDERLT